MNRVTIYLSEHGVTIYLSVHRVTIQRLVHMMRTVCHHVLTNQMTLYICCDTCTIEENKTTKMAEHPSHAYNQTSQKKQNDKKNVANF